MSTTVFDPNPKNANNPQVMLEDGATPATDQDIEDAAIWMGLLINNDGVPTDPGVTGGGANPDATRATVAVIAGEHGPYLNEIPESAGPRNGGTGSYTWVMGNDGNVYGVYVITGIPNLYYCGFSGEYP